MAIDEEYQEVRFDKYCETCKHKDCEDTEEPCNECLDNPTNLYSQKPVRYEEKKNAKKA